MSTYKITKAEPYHGILARKSQLILRHADGRWGGRVYLYQPSESDASVPKGKSLAQDYVHKKSKEVAEMCMNEALEKLMRDNSEVILQLVRDEKLPQYTIGDFVWLCWDNIALEKAWLRNEEKYRRMWEGLPGKIRNTPLASFVEKDSVNDTKSFISKQKRSLSTEGLSYMRMFADIVEVGRQNGLVKENPYRQLAREELESTKALRNLARKAMTQTEMRLFVACCQSRITLDDEISDLSLRTALLLNLLMGLTTAEVCGLNIDSWYVMELAGETLSWLKIEREYRQERGKTPELTNIFGNNNRYRNTVCTQFVESLLSTTVSARIASGAGPQNPLFCVNGERLTPDILKASVKELLHENMTEGVRYDLSSRKYFGKGDDRLIANTDVLRSSFKYYSRAICKMTVSEIGAYLGMDRGSTYGVHYTDWCNPLVMLQIRQKLARLDAFIFESPCAECEPEIMLFAQTTAIVDMQPCGELCVRGAGKNILSISSDYKEES